MVLVGPMGAGKSAVGALLAADLGVELRDTDADVEASTGVSIAELVARQGEAAFRAVERAAVRAALEEHEGVLALGGGAVLDPGTRAALAGHPVVLLDVTWEHARARVGDGASRPLLRGDAAARWQELREARREAYAQVASVTVLTDGLSAAQVAAAALAALAALA